ncbi:MAG: hypothetical protein SGILL_010487 [Bacillariaceae sp.]
MTASVLNNFMKELVGKNHQIQHEHPNESTAVKVVMTDDNARTHDLRRPRVEHTSWHSISAPSSIDDSVRNSPPRQPTRTLELPDSILEPPVGRSSSRRSSMDMSDLEMPTLRRSMSHESTHYRRRSSLDLSQSKHRTTRWQSGDAQSMFSSDSQLPMIAPPRAPSAENSPKMLLSRKQRKHLRFAMDNNKSIKLDTAAPYQQTLLAATARSLDDSCLDDPHYSQSRIQEDPRWTLEEVLDVVGDRQGMSIRA